MTADIPAMQGMRSALRPTRSMRKMEMVEPRMRHMLRPPAMTEAWESERRTDLAKRVPE